MTCSDEHINVHERYESDVSLLGIRGSCRHMSSSRHKLMSDGRVVNCGSWIDGGCIDKGGWIGGSGWMVNVYVGIRIDVIITVRLYFFHPHIQTRT